MINVVVLQLKVNKTALTGKPWSSVNLTEILAILALGTAFIVRIILLNHPPPLWIDETFTGAISAQPSFADVISLAYFDSPPELYYLFMHVWQMAFGLTDASLRAPSFIFSVAAPASIVFATVPGLSRSEKLTWAALIALWAPGIGFSEDARFYALLLLFCTLQTLAFYRLLVEPTKTRTVIWILSADLSILTHYDAIYLTLIQGIVFVALNRRFALRMWPLLSLGLPVGGEILWKWHILVRFTQLGTAWYPMLKPFDIIQVFLYIFDGRGIGAAIWFLMFPVWLIFSCLLGLRSTRLEPSPEIKPLVWTAISAGVGCAAIVAVGFIKPSFTWRYLTPFEPGLILGLIVIARTAGRHLRDVANFSLILITLLACKFWISAGADTSDSIVKSLSLEKASESVMESGASSVIFAWDNPNAMIISPDLLKAVGGFIFHRDNYPIQVKLVKLNLDVNPNYQLLAAAEPEQASIIWLYDRSIRNTEAQKYAVEISQINKLYTCQNFGDNLIGSISCSRF